MQLSCKMGVLATNGFVGRAPGKRGLEKVGCFMAETLSQLPQYSKVTREALKVRSLATFKTIGVLVMATMLISVWAGCKDNTAAVSSRHVPRPASRSVPSAFRALPVANNQTAMVDPVHSNLWASARWYPLAHVHGRPAASQAAAYYSPNNLYIAINAAGSAASSPSIPRSKLWRHSCVEVWLDTTRRQTGMNFYEIVVAPNGRVNQVWHKSGSPPHPLENGSVDFDHPFASIPWKTPGLVARTWPHLHTVKPGWSAVVKIPLKNLPRALASACRPGARYRVNILRYQWKHRHGSARLDQASLFPVGAGFQPFAPYRMGRLVLGHTAGNDLALLTPTGK